MHPSPIRRPPQAAAALMSAPPPMCPGSGGEPSLFDLLGEYGDAGPASPGEEQDGGPQDTSGQRWDSTTEIAEQARHEAEIENRIAELRKEGFWTPRRLSKFPEPPRPKVHWDYLCEEMQWLSGDFAQERRWKRGVARKVVRMVVRHHEELKQKEERARREEQAKLRRIATSIAKEVRQFWSNVEKVVQFKQQSRLEAKRKKALDLQLDFIVGQTEKYSDLLSQSLQEAAPAASKTSSSGLGSSQGGSLRTSPTPSLCHRDGDFFPDKGDEEEEDDEETIEMEERQDGNDAEAHRLELELLKREGELPLDQLLQALPPAILQEEPDMEDVDSDPHDDDSSSCSEEDLVEEEDDDEFTANEDEAKDEEETIEAEEALDAQADHTKELSELAQEGEMSIDDLLKKYSLVRTDEEDMGDPSESSHVTDVEEYGSSDCESSDCESEGVEFLVKPEDEEAGTDQLQNEVPGPKKEITDIAATAESLQPKGYTLATTQVKTPVPFLLRGDLREYQHIGLEWLVTMYEKKLNGILADEMGLGKTIQTISLLAHLACERGNWGPHLIIVPTSVILNWEMELKRWCPSFKILTYYGSQKERKLKRQGWTKANAFHVCITSYKLVLQDHQAFRRKNWRYLILDEAQNIKNFKSQRWQSLLNFNSQRRLLLTGTPLQNSLMELWSLMHFLMPHVFQSHREFKEWFSNPLTGMIEGSQEYNEGLVRRLHKVLRPFLLRRIKQDVEKQMPKKYEHVIYCRLSKRQRFLYDDFMSQASTRDSLTSGHFMSVINILMQLRKVCNHPNLFDPRPIHSPFITSAICYSVPSLVLHTLQQHPLECVDMSFYNLVNLEGQMSRYESDSFLPRYKPSRLLIQEIAHSPELPPRPRPLKMKVNRMLQPVVKADPRPVVMVNSSRPVQKPPDTATSSPPPPVPPSPPSHATPSPPVLPVPGSAPAVASVPAPPLVPPCQAPAPVTAVCSVPGKPVPVQNSQPVYSTPQRFILTPDMQARLPSGEVISLGQLASFSGRPLQSPSVSKPLTLQLQGAKLTLGASQVRPVGMGQPRPVQGNVVHLVSSGGQHHLLSQPAQLALIQALAQQAASSPAPTAAPQLLPNSPAAQLGVQTVSIQGLQHPLVNNASLSAAGCPTMASPAMAAQGVVKIVVRQAPRDLQPCPQRPAQVRPVMRVLPSPHAELPGPREASMERAAPVVATSTITLASSPLLMVSSPAAAARLPSPNAVAGSSEESAAPSLSGVALRLVATGTSPAVQLTNHQSSPPRHTASPALPNCFPTPIPASNCNPAPISADSAPSTLPLKAALGPESALPEHHSVHNGNGVQHQLADSSSCAPAICGLSTLHSPSPPVTNLSKVSPPTYNLSLVPALIANSSTSNTARFLTSPVSLLALSALPSTNSGPSPVIYTSPTATGFPALAAASLSAPLPASSVPASLPILAAPVSGQLASFGAPLPISSTNQNALPASVTVPHPSMDAHSVPLLPSPASTSLLATPGTSSLLEASSNQPLLLAPDSTAMPLLDHPATEALSPLVLNTSVKLPSMASTPVPILPGSAVPLLAVSSSNATVPLLAAPTVKASASFVNVMPSPSSLPLLSSLSTTLTSSPAVATMACVTSQPASVPVSSARPMTPASSAFTTSAASSSSPSLISTSSPLPSWLSKPPIPFSSMQCPAPALLPSGLLEAQASSVPTEVPLPMCSLSTDSPTPLLPSATLEASMGSTLVGSVSAAGYCSAQSALPTIQLKPSTSQPSRSVSTVSPSMPTSTPALFPSTPIAIPPLPASAPTPVPSLPASSPDPSSVLSAPDSSTPLAPSVDTAPMSSATSPTVLSVTTPLTVTATSPSLMVSAPSHIPALPSQLPDQSLAAMALPPVVPLPKTGPSPAASRSNLPSSTPISAPLDTTTPVNNQESSHFPESSLSLSVAVPPPASVTLGTTPESEIKLEQEEPRFSYGAAAANTSVRPRRLLPPPPRSPFYLEPLEERRRKQKMERLERIFQLNERRCSLAPVYGAEVLGVCTLQHSPLSSGTSAFLTETLRSCVFSPEQRLEQLHPLIERFIIAMPPVEAPQITLHTSHPPPSMLLQQTVFREALSRELTPHTRCLHRIISNMRTQFPDLRLIQYDCGKLQTMDHLLRDLKYGGHRVLIFTQMTRMLDVLEQFLNYHGHIYLRLDGSTRVEQRQVLMERFNMDKRIFCFILSTRSGGVGVNLTGADTVIFYDSDWNPTMDAQAQDRCHRIGQTRDVHIYRLVSERTVEENILKKAQQKRMLGDMAIEGGNFTTAYFKQQTIRDLFDMEDVSRKESDAPVASPELSAEDGPAAKHTHILEQALGRAEDEEDTLAASLVRAEQVADLDEFNENAPLEPEEEEQSRVEQEISALVEQLTPIERYAMYFLEASLEEISKEELKQAEEQVEAARKDLILAKDEGCPNYEEKWEEEVRKNRRVRTPVPARPPGERVRVSERLKGNRAAENAEITENVAGPEVAATTEVLQVVSSQNVEAAPVSDVEDTSHVTEAATDMSMVPEAVSPGSPAAVQTKEGSLEVENQEIELADTAIAKEEGLAELGTETPVISRDGSEEPPPGSPVAPAPKEELTPPRTPRRKVTADCEILLAGASELSPTSKVLRRLPGRLVTVVQERLPVVRRQNRGRGQQAMTDKGTPVPNVTGYQSPPCDLLSEDSSETGSPPPKRKRGRPPKNVTEASPTAVSALSPPVPSPISPLPIPAESVLFLVAQRPTSPVLSTKLKLENENPPTEKRKRGRPPKRREASPAVSPTSPTVTSPAVTLSPPAVSSAWPLSPVSGSATPPVSTPVNAACGILDTTAAKMSASPVKAGDKEGAVVSALYDTAPSIIPTDSSNIPSLGGEATSSSAEEPGMPVKRKPGRPRRSPAIPKINSSPVLHSERLDSSPDRTPSPQPLSARRRPPKVETKVQNSSLVNTENSSEEEEDMKRTPLTRSSRTRLETNSAASVVSKNSEASPKLRHTHSPRATPFSEKASTKKRKPPSGSSPSPPSSPNGSSSGKQKVPRRKSQCPPVERVLRSALTANPASNTRSSRNQVIYSPSSHRGRKAKT